MYGGDSFLKGRPNFTEEAHSTEKAHFYGGDSVGIGGSVLRSRFILRRTLTFTETHFYEEGSFLQRLIFTQETDFHRGRSF